jgi:phospholipid/cholesterol/gamma-HCH transport system substrate-binding protein
MRTVEISVGAFMMAGIFSLFVLAVKVSGFNIGTEANTYSVYARFENIGGLTVRAKVTVAGVVVGKVTSIDLDQKRFSALVRMEINSDIDQLTLDTTASILTEGLLGGKYIGLIPGADEQFLRDGDEITDTQSALVLEELIGKFMLDMVKG